jgi:hypothetical protein
LAQATLYHSSIVQLTHGEAFLFCIPAFTSLQDENFLQGFLYQAELGFLQQEWI